MSAPKNNKENQEPDRRSDYIEFLGIWSEEDAAAFEKEVASCRLIESEADVFS